MDAVFIMMRDSKVSALKLAASQHFDGAKRVRNHLPVDVGHRPARLHQPLRLLGSVEIPSLPKMDWLFLILLHLRHECNSNFG